MSSRPHDMEIKVARIKVVIVWVLYGLIEGFNGAPVLSNDEMIIGMDPPCPGHRQASQQPGP